MDRNSLLRSVRHRIRDSVPSENGREPAENVGETGTNDTAEATLLVQTLYRALLGRDPDRAGLGHYVTGALAQGLGARDIAARLMTSHEFINSNLPLLGQLPCLRNFDPTWVSSSRQYYNKIATSGITVNDVAEVYAAAGLSHDHYTAYHLNRFRELFGYLKAHFTGSATRPEFLEIGTSAHTTPFYRRFFDCQYDTICRPPSTGGPTKQWADKAGSRNHWEVDLNNLEDHASTIEEVPRGYYHAVICAEVVEHLTRAPRDIIAFAISRLRDGGILYLTTPNFLTPAKVVRVYLGYAPLPGFTEYNNNIHAHQHFREYTIYELVAETNATYGQVRDIILSNCWDRDKYENESDVMYRSNIVMIITPPDRSLRRPAS